MSGSVGIVGQGFVGNAIYEGLINFFTIETFDIDAHQRSSCENMLDLIDKSEEIVFVCVPTPMTPEGECDISVVKSVVLKIDEVAKILDKKIVAVIKSTVPPGTTDFLNQLCTFTSCVFSPEFLTEANSVEDFKTQTRIILGGNGAKTVKRMFRKPFPSIPIIVTKAETAEMIKYFTNAFLATKVIFANEMYEICQKCGVDYDKVSEYALYDERIGKSHLAVPGPDGDRGFGGHCFPKDMSALIYFAESHGVSPGLFKKVLDVNDELRTDRDWERMKGRAVVSD